MKKGGVAVWSKTGVVIYCRIGHVFNLTLATTNGNIKIDFDFTGKLKINKLVWAFHVFFSYIKGNTECPRCLFVNFIKNM